MLVVQVDEVFTLCLEGLCRFSNRVSIPQPVYHGKIQVNEVLFKVVLWLVIRYESIVIKPKVRFTPWLVPLDSVQVSAR